MGRKSNAKQPPNAAASPPPPRRPVKPIVFIAPAVLVIAVAALVLGRPGQPQSTTEAASPTTTTAQAQPIAEVPANAKFGPHTQANLPPLPFNGYPPVRPLPVVTAVYKFAAEHPEVLGYVPCYCGCERGGHRGNDDCFVTSRNANGDVTSWEPHGMT